MTNLLKAAKGIARAGYRIALNHDPTLVYA